MGKDKVFDYPSPSQPLESQSHNKIENLLYFENLIRGKSRESRTSGHGMKQVKNAKHSKIVGNKFMKKMDKEIQGDMELRVLSSGQKASSDLKADQQSVKSSASKARSNESKAKSTKALKSSKMSGKASGAKSKKSSKLHNKPSNMSSKSSSKVKVQKSSIKVSSKASKAKSSASSKVGSKKPIGSKGRRKM